MQTAWTETMSCEESPWKAQNLSAHVAMRVDTESVERYLRHHGEGTHRRGRILWPLIVLELWCRGLRRWRDFDINKQPTQAQAA